MSTAVRFDYKKDAEKSMSQSPGPMTGAIRTLFNGSVTGDTIGSETIGMFPQIRGA